MVDGFKLFEGQRGRRVAASGPVVSISKNGAMNLNQFALGMFGKKVPENVQLLYNPEKRMIAIKPASAEDEYTYKLRPDKSGSRSTIGAKSFANYYGIDLSRRHSLEPQKMEDLLVIQLDESDLVPIETREPVEA